MTPHGDRPSWIIEQLLDWRLFACCGDQDLFPFQCYGCLRPLVLCYECDTLYTDLSDLQARSRTYEATACPHCQSEYGSDLMTSPRYRVTFDRWHEAGLDHLLVERPISELEEMAAATADQFEEWLQQASEVPLECA